MSKFRIGNVIKTHYGKYNQSCPVCDDGYITYSQLHEYNLEKQIIRKKLLDDLIKMFDKSLIFEWNKRSIIDLLEYYKKGE